MYILDNGRRVAEDLAQIALEDYLAVDGLAVAVRLYRSRPFRLEAHLQELAAALAAPYCEMAYALNSRQIARDLATLTTMNGLYDGLVTMAVLPQRSAGRMVLRLRENLPSVWSRETRGAALVTTTVVFPPQATAARLPLLHAPWPRAAAAEGRAARADGGFMHAADGSVLLAAYNDGFLYGDAAASAVFAVVNRTLLTPDPEKNRLPVNIMRQMVCETAARLGMVVYYEPLTAEVFDRAEEIFTADSAREIFPLRYYGPGSDLHPEEKPAGRTFDNWPVALELQTTLQKRIENELGL